MPVAWNPDDKAAGIALSGSDLLATDTAGVAWSVVRANTPIPPNSKVFYEITVHAIPNGSGFFDGLILGLADSSALLDGALGFAPQSDGYSMGDLGHFFATRAHYVNGVRAIASAGYIDPQVVVFNVDTVNNEVWYTTCQSGGCSLWNSDFVPNPTAPGDNVFGYDISYLVPPFHPAFSSRYAGQTALMNATGPFCCSVTQAGFTPLKEPSGAPFLWTLT